MSESESVLITTKEVYDAVKEVGGKLDSLAVTVNGIKAVTDDHESRIRKVERWVWALGAAVVVLGGGPELLKALNAG